MAAVARHTRWPKLKELDTTDAKEATTSTMSDVDELQEVEPQVSQPRRRSQRNTREEKKTPPSVDAKLTEAQGQSQGIGPSLTDQRIRSPVRMEPLVTKKSDDRPSQSSSKRRRSAIEPDSDQIESIGSRRRTSRRGHAIEDDKPAAMRGGADSVLDMEEDELESEGGDEGAGDVTADETETNDSSGSELDERMTRVTTGQEVFTHCKTARNGEKQWFSDLFWVYEKHSVWPEGDRERVLTLIKTHGGRVRSKLRGASYAVLPGGHEYLHEKFVRLANHEGVAPVRYLWVIESAKRKKKLSIDNFVLQVKKAPRGRYDYTEQDDRDLARYYRRYEIQKYRTQKIMLAQLAKRHTIHTLDSWTSHFKANRAKIVEMVANLPRDELRNRQPRVSETAQIANSSSSSPSPSKSALGNTVPLFRETTPTPPSVTTESLPIEPEPVPSIARRETRKSSRQPSLLRDGIAAIRENDENRAPVASTSASGETMIIKGKGRGRPKKEATSVPVPVAAVAEGERGDEEGSGKVGIEQATMDLRDFFQRLSSTTGLSAKKVSGVWFWCSGSKRRCWEECMRLQRGEAWSNRLWSSTDDLLLKQGKRQHLLSTGKSEEDLMKREIWLSACQVKPDLITKDYWHPDDEA